MAPPEDTLGRRLAEIRTDGGRTPWPERRRWVAEILQWLGTHREDQRVHGALVHLAGDPKWEVRKAVADALLDVPDDAFAAIVRTLANDSNAYVANSVRTALARRAPKPPRSGSRGRHSGLQQLLREIRAAYGPAAERATVAYADRFAGESLRSLAHDIRTILTPLRLSLNKIRAGEGGTPGPRAGLDRVDRWIADLETLARDVDAFARPLDLDLRPENLAEMIADAAQRARDHLLGQGRDSSPVSIDIEIPDPLHVTVSRPHLVMALTNLIKNALESYERRAGFHAGTVNIRASHEGAQVLLVIEDHGGGLSARDLAKLREGIPGHSSKGGLGTGFGLPIAKRNIEAHRGTMVLDAKEGEGVTVTVRIPDGGS